MNNRTERNRRLRLRDTESKSDALAAFNIFTVRSQSEVAKMLGISRQAVQQIERTALRKIRLRMANPFEE